jgi:hypothetical protein
MKVAIFAETVGPIMIIAFAREPLAPPSLLITISCWLHIRPDHAKVPSARLAFRLKSRMNVVVKITLPLPLPPRVSHEL